MLDPMALGVYDPMAFDVSETMNVVLKISFRLAVRYKMD